MTRLLALLFIFPALCLSQVSPVPVSRLPVASVANPTDVVPMVQSGVTKQASIAAVRGSPYIPIPTTPVLVPVAGVNQFVLNSYESNTLRSIANEGAIWPFTGGTYFGFSKSFGPTDGSAGGTSSTLFSFAVSKGTGSFVNAILADCDVAANNGACWGINPVARTEANVTNVKLVGAEFDVQPVASNTINSGSAGVLINAFSLPIPVAIQLGGNSGGSWTNGYVSAFVTGSHFSVLSGDPTTSTSFIDTRNGTFSAASLILGNGASQQISFGGATFGTHPSIYGDTSHNINIQMGSANALIVHNSAGTPSLIVNTASGVPAISVSGAVQYASFTVATLPTCNSTIKGGMVYVTDQNGAPSYRGALTGGGALAVPAFCNGSTWEAH